MDDSLYFVEFDKYCAACKHEELDEKFDPCNECLTVPARYGTSEPEKWEEKEK